MSSIYIPPPNFVSLATENYFYLLYTEHIKGIGSPESTLPILYYARPMVSIFVAMSVFFQQLSGKKYLQMMIPYQ